MAAFAKPLKPGKAKIKPLPKVNAPKKGFPTKAKKY